MIHKCITCKKIKECYYKETVEGKTVFFCSTECMLNYHSSFPNSNVTNLDPIIHRYCKVCCGDLWKDTIVECDSKSHLVYYCSESCFLKEHYIVKIKNFIL